jgi:hypothetical protein
MEIFNFYCIDRLKPLGDELYITYRDEGTIRKQHYYIGLKAKVKKIDSFVLYTATEDDLDVFLFIPVDFFYDNYERLMTTIITKEEFLQIIKRIYTINIFEFVSMLDFVYIYTDFKDIVDMNWQTLDMDSLMCL